MNNDLSVEEGKSSTTQSVERLSSFYLSCVRRQSFADNNEEKRGYIYRVSFCETYSEIQVITVRILIIFKITKKSTLSFFFSWEVPFIVKLPLRNYKVYQKCWIDYCAEFYFSSCLLLWTPCTIDIQTETIFHTSTSFLVSNLLTSTLVHLQNLTNWLSVQFQVHVGDMNIHM